VVYNASNNELVRTQTLVKSAIVQVDAAPFKQWYLTHYGVDIGRKKKAPAAKKDAAEGQEGEAAAEEAKKSNHVQRSLRSVSRDAHLTPTLKSNLAVEGCWRAFLPALGSVAELTGTSLRVKSWSST